MKKRITSTLLAIALIIGFFPAMMQQAEASGTYQLSKAVEYALAHAEDPGSNDPNGCAKFVSACLAAGGITVPNQYMYNSSDRVDPDYSGTIEGYSNPHTCARAMLKWLMEQGYYTVKRPSNGANIDWGEINVGDIVFMTSGSIYGHVVIVTGRNPETGESLYSAHSNSRLNYPLGNKANYVVQLSKYSTPAASTLSINPLTYPTENMALGEPFYFRGSITSNYPVTSATVQILLRDWSTVIQEKTVYPNKTNVDFLSDGLDSLKFGQLSEGSYIFRLMAADQSGTTKECSYDFSIGTHSYGTEWKYDATNHWHACACGDKADVAAHTYGDWEVTTSATETIPGEQKRTCTACGYQETQEIPAIGHSYGTEWTYDATNHWHTCACGDKADTAAHTFGDWSVVTPATETQPGKQQRTCTVCGYAETQEIPVIVKDTAQLIVQKAIGRAGETVTVSVEIKNNPGFGGMAYDVRYDNTVLELVSYELGLGSGICVVSGENYKDRVNLQYAGIENITGDGALVTFTFKIKDTAPEGFTEIRVTPEEGTPFRYEGMTEKDFALEAVNGGIEVVDYLKGDINGDGKVNIRDAARLMQYLAGWDVEYVAAALDVNADGQVNNRDAARLMQYLAGWDVEIH